MRWRTTTPPAPTGEPDPSPDLDQAVQAYAAQARAADELAEVDTAQLDEPTANPNALDTLNAERDRAARERIQLDYARERMTAEAEHARLVDRLTEERRRASACDTRSDRAVSEAVADADEAAAELEQVRRFEHAASPVSATRRLMAAARTWRREEFAYAVAGSALSAVGISALLLATTPLAAWMAPVVAVLVETVLTVRVIRLISQRAELAEQHKGTALAADSPGGRALVFLTRQIIALLSVSVLLNLVGLVAGAGALGVIGALGAAGAAVASWSAWRTSQAATATVASNISAWQGEHWAQARQELRTRASGAHIPHLAEAGSPDEAERLRRVLAGLAEEQIAALADRGTDALTVMLNHTPGGPAPGTPAPADPQDPGGGATGADLPVPQGATPGATAGATSVAQHAPEGRTWPRPPSPEQGRRQLVEYAQWQVGRGQEPSVRDAARRMGTSARSITRYRDALRGDYPALMEAFRQP